MGLSSGPRTADVVDLPRPLEGEACDPAEVFDLCEEGTECDTFTERCSTEHDPVITDLTALRIDDDSVRLLIEGVDDDEDALHLLVNFLDARGRPVAYEGETDILFFPEEPITGDETFLTHTLIAGLARYPSITAVRVRIVDRRDNESAPETTDIIPIPRPDVGWPCDPTELTDLCVEGAVCDVESEVCVVGSPPVLEDLTALRIDDEALSLVGNGTDDDGDVRSYAVTFLDGAGAPIELGGEEELIWSIEEPITGEEEFLAISMFAGMAAVPDAVRVRAALVDRAGLRSDPLTVDIDDMPRPGVGAACDPAQIYNRCVDGASCDPDTERCVRDTAPELTSLEVLRLSEGTYRSIMEGTDAEGSVTGYRLTFVDAAERDLGADFDGDGEPDIEMLQFFLWSVEGERSFTAAGDSTFYDWRAREDLTPEGATGLRVELIDASGATSDSLIAHWEDIPVRRLGEPCDPLGLYDQCEPPRVCSAETEECIEPADAEAELCDDDHPRLRSGVGSRVEAIGTYSFMQGSCGGWGPEAVFELTVAVPSRVVITTDRPATPRSADTVIHLRGECDEPASQVGCDDNSGADYLAELEVAELEPGTYTVIVDTNWPTSSFEVLATVTPL